LGSLGIWLFVASSHRLHEMTHTCRHLTAVGIMKAVRLMLS